VPVRSVRIGGGEVSVRLASGTEVLLGSPTGLPLKLAVAARILPLAPSSRYLDVSVPERVVATDSHPG